MDEALVFSAICNGAHRGTCDNARSGGVREIFKASVEWLRAAEDRRAHLAALG
jgi:hypothetical protein